LRLRIGLPASFAQSAYFEPHHANLKPAFLGDLPFQLFKGRTRVLHDRPALEASHVTVVAAGFHFVIMLLAFEVHELQFIDQPAVFEERNGSIDDGSVDIGILLLGNLQQRCYILSLAKMLAWRRINRL
jgi:hypothetical protein